MSTGVVVVIVVVVVVGGGGGGWGLDVLQKVRRSVMKMAKQVRGRRDIEQATNPRGTLG